MNTTRKTLTLAAMVASLSLLTACSKIDDASAPTQAPVPPVTPAPQEQQSAPADQQSMQDKIKESAAAAKEKAAEVGQAVSDKAGELAHEAGEAANSVRESVKEGAAKADAAIQGTVGDSNSGAK